MNVSVRIDGAQQAAGTVGRLIVTAEGLGRTGVEVGTNVVSARWVHDGTRPHTIEPRTQRALFWPGAAHPVRRVRHPGYKGNPFLANALSASQERVRQVIATVLAAAATGARGARGDQALLAAGLIVQAEAQRLVNVKTGTLRKSLTVVYAR